MKKKNFPIASSGVAIFTQLNSNCKNDNHSHLELEKRDASRLSQKPKQLTIWESPQTPVSEVGLFRHKPQIVSTPGVCPKERSRYRVVLGGEVLGERLSLDEALKLAKGGKG
jgi:hypothetical protein